MPQLTRRTFAQLAACAAAFPRIAVSQPQPPVRFAVVGLGSISDIFMKACARSSHCKVTALVSGHGPQKAPKYQALYNIPQTSVYTYDAFDQIAENPNIDAVYIGLPNSLHAEYTIRAAKAGKHVLCEKPMAISSAECRAMIDACKQANVKLMIAYRIHYDPIWLAVHDLVRSGALGVLEGFQGGFYTAMPDGWRLNRTLAGGGSLMDLGVYPLNALRWISAEEPSSYTAQTATKDPGPRYANIEESLEFTLKMPSGILASSGCSYGQRGTHYLTINGSKGHIQVSPAYGYDGVAFRGETVNGPVEQVSPGVAPYQFTLEADHFAHCIRSNVQPNTPGEEGLKDLLAIEAIYQAAGTPII